MRTLKATVMGVLVVAAVPELKAHDLWLVPPEKAAVDQPVLIQCNVGMDFPKSESAPDPGKFKRRLLVLPDGSEGELNSAGQKDNSGLLQFVPAKAGVYVAAVETPPKLITLKAQAFNEYLITDGMAHIYLLRAREKTLDQPGKERYSKHVKAIVAVGDGGGDPCRVLGMTLELVPLRNPLKVKVGEALPLRVLFQGKPLAEANVGWQHPGDGETARGYVRTDAKGEALIPMARTGLITVRLTHMTRPKAAEYEWESFWATLTWRLSG
jgi:uncharacterized GH25 family protein